MNAEIEDVVGDEGGDVAVVDNGVLVVGNDVVEVVEVVEVDNCDDSDLIFSSNL